jgi:hypothetical protein
MSLKEKLAIATAAFNSGRLVEYVPAKSLDASAPEMPKSWGPAMRV